MHQWHLGVDANGCEHAQREEQGVTWHEEHRESTLGEDDEGNDPQCGRSGGFDDVLRIQPSWHEQWNQRDEETRHDFQSTVTFVCAHDHGELPDDPSVHIPGRSGLTTAGAATGPTAVGVGPAARPWPEDARLDPDLLEHGDRRNVVDRYRYWSVEAIVAELDTRRRPLHIAIQNWEHDFNIGSVVRTANAFNVAGVHILGRRRWNRRGAMVTDRYLHIHHHPDVPDFLTWLEAHDITPVGVDNLPGSVALELATLPRDCCLVFGSEGAGLTDEVVAGCSQLVAITQYGSTRSMNAGAAAAIAMWAWGMQHPVHP